MKMHRGDRIALDDFGVHLCTWKTRDIFSNRGERPVFLKVVLKSRFLLYYVA